MGEKKGLFGGLFSKKNVGCCNLQIIEDTGETESCGCQGGCYAPAEVSKEKLDPNAPTIKVLGTGCKSCVVLEQNVRLALSQITKKFNLVKVNDLSEIASYGVMSTPGLVVEGEVISCGRVLKPNEIARVLENISKK